MWKVICDEQPKTEEPVLVLGVAHKKHPRVLIPKRRKDGKLVGWRDPFTNQIWSVYSDHLWTRIPPR